MKFIVFHQLLLRSYLDGKSQYVNISNFKFDVLKVSHGVPFLYNIFMNDITLIPNCDKVLYTNDAVFYVNNKDFIIFELKLRALILEFHTWFANNKLIINTIKTKLIIFSSKFFYAVLSNIYLNRSLLEWVPSVTYLCIILDKDLNFNKNFHFIIISYLNLWAYFVLLKFLFLLRYEDVL